MGADYAQLAVSTLFQKADFLLYVTELIAALIRLGMADAEDRGR